MKPELLLKAAARYGTPLYVYDEDLIRKNYRAFLSAYKSRYKKVRIMYALKTNPSLALCHILRQEGCGADVISDGELLAARKVGIKQDNIIFTSNSKTDSELEAALQEDVVINLDSTDELYRLHQITKNSGKTARISFRVNPSVDPKTHPKIATGLKDSKFGLHLEGDIAFNAYKTAKDLDWIDIEGVHTHIGSQITDMDAFRDAAEKMMEFACQLKEKLGITLKFIDLGGGLGISYKGEAVPTPDDMAEAVVPVVKEYNKRLGYEPELWFEPGRYIMADAGVLICRVTGVKETPYKKFVNVDAGFNVLARPAMYDAYHRVQVLNRISEEAAETYDIAGNICESGDLLAKERKLPKVSAGDMIMVLDVGAYGFSMASQYNLRPRPAELLLWGETAELIRERETVEDFFAKQRVPKDLLK